MKELEAEAVLLAGPLYDLAGREHDCAHPVAALGLLAFVNEQQARLQNAPQLCPGLESTSNLQKCNVYVKCLYYVYC